MKPESLFHAALAKTDPAERAGFLDEACCADRKLRQEIENLIKAHEAQGEFMEKPAVEQTVAFTPNDSTTGFTLQSLDQIGPYKLREKLGEGGMGTVYVAEQKEPVQRRVAIKLIKGGSDSKGLSARFEQERQALALMDHPNIAKVFDAGVFERTPYFVMELIKGVPITKYCDDARLSPKQRLELFIPVCQAVQHAHQKGIIHRDLKPSNILIGLYDGKPIPKIIDFGVAKATGSRLTDQSIYTEVGSLVGTLEYMSPEQAELNNLDIDTRSDIYALGVILYELLTGSVPFSRNDLALAGFGEMLRVIKEVEPTKPSTKLSGSGTLPSIAANRHMEPAKLSAMVRGELDWIVMKCLEKDRSRRYETANQLGMEIQRYLANEPVLAGPPSAGYLLRKLVARNKGLVIAAGLVLGTLILGITGTTWGLIKASNERDQTEIERQIALHERDEKEKARQAEAGRAQGERQANNRAQSRLGQIERGNAVLTSIFEDLDIRKVKDENIALEEVLAKRLVKAASQLEGNAVGDLLVVAGLQDKLGKSLLNLGYPHEAIELFKKSGDTRTAKLGHDHPDTLHSMGNLGEGYRESGKLDLALPLYEQTLKLMNDKLGVDHPDTLDCLGNLALGYWAGGKLDKALPLFEETVKRMKAKWGTNHPDTLTAMGNQALGFLDAGKYNSALPLLQETLKLRKAILGADHVDTILSMNNLAGYYHKVGKYDLALPLFVETVMLRKTKLGVNHPNTLTSMSNLANVYVATKKLDLALPIMEETLILRKAKLGNDHPNTLRSMNYLAEGYRIAKRNDLALPLFEEALKVQKIKLGPDHPDTLSTMNKLALCYNSAEKPVEATQLFEETLKLRKTKLGIDHPDTLISMNNLADAYQAANKIDLLLSLRKEILAVRKGKFGMDHPDTLSTMNQIAMIYMDRGEYAQAEQLILDILKIRTAKLGDDHTTTLSSRHNLGRLRQRQMRFVEAEKVCEALLAQRKAKLGPDHPNTLATLNIFATVTRELRKHDLAISQYQELWDRRKKTLPKDNSLVIDAQNQVGLTLLLAGRFAEAETHLLASYDLGSHAKDFSKEWLQIYCLRLHCLYTAWGKLNNAHTWRSELKKYGETTDGLLLQPGIMMLENGHFIAAETMLRECLEFREAKNPHIWNTFNMKSLLGGALLGQKKYIEAEPLLLKGYEGMKQHEKTIPEHCMKFLHESIDRLIQLYTETNKPEEVKKWQAERDKLFKPQPAKR